MKKKLVLMGITAILLVTTLIGGALAAFQAGGDPAANQISIKNLKIQLSEGEISEAGADGSDTYRVIPGDRINNPVLVENKGNTELYTRVVITRYWGTEENGVLEKDFELDPEEIRLELTDDWLWDQGSSTKERVVLYYTKPVKPGESTTRAMNGFEIPAELSNEYGGKVVCLDCRADAIQMIAIEDAALAEWGVALEIDERGIITGVEN